MRCRKRLPAPAMVQATPRLVQKSTPIQNSTELRTAAEKRPAPGKIRWTFFCRRPITFAQHLSHLRRTPHEDQDVPSFGYHRSACGYRLEPCSGCRSTLGNLEDEP